MKLRRGRVTLDLKAADRPAKVAPAHDTRVPVGANSKIGQEIILEGGVVLEPERRIVVGRRNLVRERRDLNIRLRDEARDRSRDRRWNEKEHREETDCDHDLVVTAPLGLMGLRRAASATGTAALEYTREAREGFTGDGWNVAGAFAAQGVSIEDDLIRKLSGGT